jgi:hypothetical protein
MGDLAGTVGLQVSERAAYSRVYWSVMDDPKFDGVREEPRHLGSWALLLIVADMAWPAPAFRPPTVSLSSFRVLVTAGLIDEMSGGRYRVHGLDAERNRRRDSATRLRTGRDPDRRQLGPSWDPVGEPRVRTHRAEGKDETRRVETSTREIDDGRADLEAFLLVTRRAPTTRQRKLLDDILDRRDITGPEWAADIMLRHPDDPIGAVIAADQEWRTARIAEARSEERPKPKPRRARGLPESTRELIEHWKNQVAASPAEGNDVA